MSQTFIDPDTFLAEQGFTIKAIMRTVRIPDGTETFSRWVEATDTYEDYEVEKFNFELVEVAPEELKSLADAADHIFYYQDAHEQYQPNAEVKWRDLPWTKVYHISQPDPQLLTEPDWSLAHSYISQATRNNKPAYSFSRVFEKTAAGAWEDITADIVDGNEEALELLTEDPIWNPDLTLVRPTGQVEDD